MVGIDHIIGKAESLSVAIERDGFMSRKTHRRGAVLAISAGVGEGVEVEAPDAAILVGAEAKMDLSISWRGVEAIWLSSRVKMSFEGFLVFQVTKAG